MNLRYGKNKIVYDTAVGQVKQEKNENLKPHIQCYTIIKQRDRGKIVKLWMLLHYLPVM